MLIVLLVIGVLLVPLGMRWENDSDYGSTKETWGMVTYILGWCVVILTLITMFVSLFFIVSNRYIDDRIAMYQEENTQIEKDIEIVVGKYMEYEQDTFDMSEVNSPTTLVQLYPELKSNTLVEQQIDVYVSNNNKIKELKNEEINVRMWKWLLYFGGN